MYTLNARGKKQFSVKDFFRKMFGDLKNDAPDLSGMTQEEIDKLMIECAIRDLGAVPK